METRHKLPQISKDRLEDLGKEDTKNVWAFDKNYPYTKLKKTFINISKTCIGQLQTNVFCFVDIEIPFITSTKQNI